MPSTYSTSLRLELMADGEKSGTWGTITNTNLGTLIEQGVAGVASVAHDDSASYTLTTNNGSSDEARNAVVLMTGALTADREVIVPDVDKVYIFKNGTSGGFALTFKTSGGSGVTIPNGRAAICYVDSGTGTVNAIDDGYFTDSIYIEGSSAGDFITAESTNAGATSGPDIKLYRNSASPADSDVLSKITFTANTDNGSGGVSVEDVEYASINVSAPETNETSGEAGKMVIALKRGGTTQNYIEIQGGTNTDADNDSIVFKTGGNAVITLDNSQNVTIANDLTVDTNTLHVDSTNNKIGIGTTSPDSTLELQNASSVPSISLGRTPYSSHGSLTIGGTATGHIASNTDEAGNSTVVVNASRVLLGNGEVTFERSANTAVGDARSWSEYMRIDPDGNVGIGISNPGSYDWSNTVDLVVGNTSGSSGLSIVTSSAAGGNIAFADGTTGDERYRGYIYYDHSDDSMGLWTAANEKVVIASDGTVSIKDTTTNEPTLKFETGTAANFMSISRDSSTGHYVFTSDETGSSFVFALDTGSGATNRFEIDRYGNVGIGDDITKTWSLGKALHIGNAENSLWGEADYAFHMMQNAYYNSGWKYVASDEANRFALEDGKFIWATAGTGTADAALTFSERMRLTNDGLLGIGTTTPRQLLHVNQQTTSSDAIIRISNSNTPAAGGGHRVEFADGTGTTEGSTVFRYAYIAGERSGASNDGHFIVGTKPDNSTSPREHLRVSSSGELTITGTYNGNARDDAYVIFGIKNSNGDSKKAQIHAVKTADISSELIFSTTASHTFDERMRIDDSGNLVVGSTDTANNGDISLTRVSSDANISLLSRSTTDSHSCSIQMQKTPATSGNYTATSSGDQLGSIVFRGVNTSAVSKEGASISVTQTGTDASTVPAAMIFDTQGTERMRIDAVGRVTMPYQPAFVATNGSSAIATETVIVFTNTNLNVGSHYSTSTGAFTAPVAGIYAFSVTGLYTRQGQSATFKVVWQKNGGFYAVACEWQAADLTYNYSTIGQSTVIVELAANDTFRLQNGDTSTHSQMHISGTQTKMCGYLIG